MRAGLKAGLVLGGAAALVAGVFFGGRAVERASDKRDAANAWARFSRCLAGDGPLTYNHATSRIHAIELGVATRKASGTPHERDARWPERCADYARKLDTAWSRLDEPDVARAEMASYERLARAGAPSLLDDFHPLLLWGAAESLGPGQAATDVVAAPPPADVLLHEEFVGGAHIVLMGAQTIIPVSTTGIVAGGDPVFGRSLTLEFYHSDVCAFAGDEAPSLSLLRARCRPVSAAIPRGKWSLGSLVGLDDGAPPMMAVSDALDGGVYSIDTGQRLVAAATPAIEGAWAKADGFCATLDRAVVNGTLSDAYSLVRRLPDGRSSRTPLDRPRYVKDHVFDTHVIGGHVLWLEGPSYERDTELYAREIFETDPALGPIVHVGTIPAGFGIGRDAVACRTREALFVELTDQEGHSVLATRKGGEWFPPQSIAPTRTDFTDDRLTCRGAEATRTAVRPEGAKDKYDRDRHPLEVVQMRCTFGSPGNEQLTSCLRPVARLPSITTTWEDIHDKRRVVATDLDGQVTLVTLGDAVLLRSAPIADLSRAPITVVADTKPLADGMLVQEVHLPTRGDAAVLVLHTARGSLALRLTAGAKLAPVTLDR